MSGCFCTVMSISVKLFKATDTLGEGRGGEGREGGTEEGEGREGGAG